MEDLYRHFQMLPQGLMMKVVSKGRHLLTEDAPDVGEIRKRITHNTSAMIRIRTR